MKHKIQVILVLILLLLLVVVIIVIVIIIVVNRTRGTWSWCGGGGASAVSYNNHPQDQRMILVLIVLAVTVIMLAVIWFKLSQIIHQPIVNRRNIVQKYYQKYRKQFLRLCCCSYHVPPGPGPGGGTVICSSIEFNRNNRNSAGIMLSTDNGSDIGTPRPSLSGNCSNTSSSGNGSNSFTNSTTNPTSTGSSNNCRKTMPKNRRRRSLSGGLVWLLIGLVWLEGPLLISCKMNSSGEHMIKINSNTNRIIGSEQQNKKFDILNNNKRYNKVYSKNSLKIGGGSSPNSSNNSGTGSGAGSGGPNGGGGGVNSNGKNNQKNNYSSKNKSNNSKGSKYRNNLGQSGKTNSDGGDTDSRSQRNQRSTSSNSNTKRLHNAVTVTSGIVNDNYKTVNDRGIDNNYFRYSNHYYHYMDPNDHHHHHNHHTPVHLADEPPPPPPSPSVPRGTEQRHHQNIDEVDKRSILASIGCPNCVFNSYNSPSKTAFISSTETFQPPTTNDKLTANYNRQPTISHLSTDMIRLESIKRQILSKLGMKTKPNVTHPLPKQFIMDTLYRADGSDYVGVNFGFHSPPQPPQGDDDFHSDFSVNDGYDGYPSDYAGNDFGRDDGGASVRDSHDRRANIVMYNSSNAANIVVDVNPASSAAETRYHHHHKNHHVGGGRPSLPATESELLSSHSYQYQKNHEENNFADMEDFFGSTKEIITFAERGRMFNGHRLIEFPSPADQVIGQHLQIRSAAIWIRIETRQQQHQNFRRRTQQQSNNNSNSNRQTNVTNLTIWVFQLSGDDLKNKEFDDLATLSTSLNVKLNQLGWQKLDITETIRQWYGRGKSEKLRLLIDCTGCGHRYNLHLFQQDNSKHTHTTHMSGDDNQFFTTTSASDRQHSQDHHHHHHNHANSFTAGYDSSSSNGSSSYNRVHRKRPPRNRKGRSHIRYGKILGQSSNNRHKGKSSSPSTSSSRSSSATSSGSGGDVDPNRPFLVIHTDPNRVRRVRRRAVDCSGAINGQCCKESFYVSFKALGWDDWIIAPHGYFANYCRGDCGGPHRTPDTFQSYHTHVMEEFRKMDRLNGMQPCCAPLKFSSMSLIYYGNEGIIKRDLPKMVVDECGCP